MRALDGTILGFIPAGDSERGMRASISIRAMSIDDHPAVHALWVGTPGIGLSESDGRAGTDAFLRRNSDLHSDPFGVDRFILFESKLSRHGPHYEEVADFPLR